MYSFTMNCVSHIVQSHLFTTLTLRYVYVSVCVCVSVCCMRVCYHNKYFGKISPHNKLLLTFMHVHTVTKSPMFWYRHFIFAHPFVSLAHHSGCHFDFSCDSMFSSSQWYIVEWRIRRHFRTHKNREWEEKNAKNIEIIAYLNEESVKLFVCKL